MASQTTFLSIHRFRAFLWKSRLFVSDQRSAQALFVCDKLRTFLGLSLL